MKIDHEEAIDPGRMIFIHGTGGAKGQTYKAQILRNIFPGMIIPDFSGDLQSRMTQLEEILLDKDGVRMIGSSLGGLMAALFAARHPNQVRKLVLLAPALTMPEFSNQQRMINIPTIVIHGTKDEVVPFQPVCNIAKSNFPNLRYIIVEDDHRLHRSAETLDWKSLVK